MLLADNASRRRSIFCSKIRNLIESDTTVLKLDVYKLCCNSYISTQDINPYLNEHGTNTALCMLGAGDTSCGGSPLCIPVFALGAKNEVNVFDAQTWKEQKNDYDM